MAITTLAGLKAGLKPSEYFLKGSTTTEGAGIYHSTFYVAGQPEAAAAPSPGLDGAALTSYAGQIPYHNPASGNGYLASLIGGYLATTTSTFTSILVCDRLWHNSGISITTTTAQAITSPTWPARDINGSTDGEGVFVGIEVSATVGAGAINNTTLDYTNSDGVSGRTGTISMPATANAGTFVFFQLQAGDRGVRSVQGITLGTSYVSGTIHLVAVRPVLDFFNEKLGVARIEDAIGIGFPRLFDDTVLFTMFLGHAGSSQAHSLTFGFAHG